MPTGALTSEGASPRDILLGSKNPSVSRVDKASVLGVVGFKDSRLLKTFSLA